jgi:hypothetical protein
VSGNFTMSQSELRELIIKNGGHIAATPNKTCTYLVADCLGSAKTAKAQKDGLDIVTEEWVHDSIAKGKLSTNKSFFLSGGGAAPAAAAADDDDDDDEDAKPAKKAPAKRKKAADADDDDDNDPSSPIDADGTTPAAADTAGKRQKKSTASGASGATTAGVDVVAPKMKTIVVKGSAPVDDKCPKASTCHVYAEGSNVYDVSCSEAKRSAGGCLLHGASARVSVPFADSRCVVLVDCSFLFV